MKSVFSTSLLNIPLPIWILQFLYVAFFLVLIYFVYTKSHSKTDLAICIAVMVAVNIIWRIALRNVF